MKLRRMKSHPAFRLEGRSRCFQSFWELELTPGEQTDEHQHHEGEEIIYLVSGAGTVRVAAIERLVAPGEVVLVPPRTDHVIANQSEQLVRAITVRSRFELNTDGLEPELEEQAEDEARSSVHTVDELIAQLPATIDEAQAIHTILELFNLGGDLTERIETTLGLQNPRALAALTEVQRRIMVAVVEITGRYRRGGLDGWLFG